MNMDNQAESYSPTDAHTNFRGWSHFLSLVCHGRHKLGFLSPGTKSEETTELIIYVADLRSAETYS